LTGWVSLFYLWLGQHANAKESQIQAIVNKIKASNIESSKSNTSKSPYKLDYKLVPNMDNSDVRNEFKKWMIEFLKVEDACSSTSNDTPTKSGVNAKINLVNNTMTTYYEQIDSGKESSKGNNFLKNAIMYTHESLYFQEKVNFCLYTKMQPKAGIGKDRKSNVMLTLSSCYRHQDGFNINQLNHLITLPCFFRKSTQDNEYFGSSSRCP
jgi:hypothetical protein